MSQLQATQSVPLVLGELPQEPNIVVGSHYVARALASMTEIPQATWEQMFPGDPECWDFYRVSEEVSPPGFSVSAIAVFYGAEIVGAVPVFQLDYRLDTPLQGRARRVGNWLYDRWPKAVSRSVIGLGSPMSDSCSIGFSPLLTHAQRHAVLRELLACLRRRASEERTSILAIKSLGRQAAELASCIEACGYHRVTNLPIVSLATSFPSFHDYLHSLPKKTRTYMQRKMRPLSEVRTEFRTSARGLEVTAV